MDQFSISQLSQFSGIKPHTIRIWEQRYKALTPHRSEGNTRYYDGTQLRRLLNIVSLSGTGIKISRLCAMSDEDLFELQEKYLEEAQQQNDYAYFISQLVSAGMNYDELSFDKSFSHCLLRFGLEKTYVNILYPMLERIGLMWSANSMPPSQEHYISNLLRQKIFTAIDSLPATHNNGRNWLLFLPEDEWHELGLLFSNYFLKSKGENVVYLGANVPLNSVEKALSDLKIDNLLLFKVHRDLPERTTEYLNELKEIAGKRNVFLAGSNFLVEDFKMPGNLLTLTSVDDLQREIDGVKIS